jgi:hypothetical protein
MAKTTTATTIAALAASMRSPMTEEITKYAINTPAAMAANLNQRIRRSSLERSRSLNPVLSGA